jgi:hypothetical protein
VRSAGTEVPRLAIELAKAAHGGTHAFSDKTKRLRRPKREFRNSNG